LEYIKAFHLTFSLNSIIFSYTNVFREVWKTARNRLPLLKLIIEELLSEL